MNERALRNIAIATSLIGLVMLFFISGNLETKIREINSINEKDVGTSVKICGEVKEKTVSKSGHIFLNLREEDSEMKVVVFNNTAKILEKSINLSNIKKKDTICIYGEVNKYKDELEIICNKAEFMEKNVF